MKGPEAKIEAYLKEQVKKNGGIAFKFVSPSNRGVSDRIVMIPGGVTVYVEVKDGNKDLSPLQKLFRRDALALGQRHEVVRSKEDVNDFIDKYFWHLT